MTEVQSRVLIFYSKSVIATQTRTHGRFPRERDGSGAACSTPLRARPVFIWRRLSGLGPAHLAHAEGEEVHELQHVAAALDQLLLELGDLQRHLGLLHVAEGELVSQQRLAAAAGQRGEAGAG